MAIFMVTCVLHAMSLLSTSRPAKRLIIRVLDHLARNILRFSLVICFSPSCYVPDCLHDLLRDGAHVHLIFPKPQYPKPLSIHFANLGLLLCILLVFLAFVFQKAEGEHHYSITGITGAIKYKLSDRQLLDLADFKRLFSSESIAKKVFFAYSHLCRCLQLIHFWKPQESLIEELKKECELERKAWLSAFGNDRFTPHLHQTVFEDPKAMEKYGNSFLSLSIQLNERTNI